MLLTATSSGVGTDEFLKKGVKVLGRAGDTVWKATEQGSKAGWKVTKEFWGKKGAPAARSAVEVGKKSLSEASEKGWNVAKKATSQGVNQTQTWWKEKGAAATRAAVESGKQASKERIEQARSTWTKKGAPAAKEGLDHAIRSTSSFISESSKSLGEGLKSKSKASWAGALSYLPSVQRSTRRLRNWAIAIFLLGILFYSVGR